MTPMFFAPSSSSPWRSPGRVLRVWLAGVVLAIAAGCAPVIADPGRLEVQQMVAAPSFYPQETGLEWSYLPLDTRLDAMPYVETIEGPTVLDGEIWIASRLTGPGRVDVQYLQFREDGMYLTRLARLGGTIDYDPPQLLMPAQESLRVGAIWSGSTVVTANFPSASPGQRTQRLSIDYVYTVVDRRLVTVSDRVYDVFVIDRTARTFGEDGDVVEEVTQQVWFAPGVGKVRHENGWFLVATNFEAGQPAP
jgi:hypothetical protein